MLRDGLHLVDGVLFQILIRHGVQRVVCILVEVNLSEEINENGSVNDSICLDDGQRYCSMEDGVIVDDRPFVIAWTGMEYGIKFPKLNTY